MENVFDAGKVPYEPAKPQKPMTTKQEVIFYLLALWDIVQLLFFGLPIFFEAFVRLFWRPKKSIAGQVVLVGKLDWGYVEMLIMLFRRSLAEGMVSARGLHYV